VITDEVGRVLSGATVLVKGTTKGTLSDAKGEFTLPGVSESSILVISMVGFISQEVTAATFLKGSAFPLRLAPALMGEVVVVGYVVHKKKKKERAVQQNNQSPSSAAPVVSILPYPNPVIAGGILNVQCQNLEKGDYRLELYSISGHLVQTAKRSYGKRDKVMMLPVDAVPAGNYLLRLTHEKNGKKFSQQVVVQ
jgi:hypothetical protein